MDRESLELWQAERLEHAVAPMKAYMNKLRRRMEKVGFSHGDPLYLAVQKAEDAIHSLWVQLHYMVCDRRRGIPGPSSGHDLPK